MNKDFWELDYECCKLETKVSRFCETKKFPAKKPRWNMKELEYETEYLSELGRKSFSPSKYLPIVSMNEAFSNNDKISPIIQHPHRVLTSFSGDNRTEKSLSFRSTSQTSFSPKINPKRQNLVPFSPKVSEKDAILDDFVDSIDDYARW